jgi:hypothetical protein
MSFRYDDDHGHIPAKLMAMESQTTIDDGGHAYGAEIWSILVSPKPSVIIRQIFWTLLTYKVEVLGVEP